jgi:hypothetical protein
MSLFDLFSGDYIKKNGIYEACGTYGEEEKCVQGFGGETNEKRLNEIPRHI